MKIDPKIKTIMRQGFKPCGTVIPNPRNAPKGSGVFHFEKGCEEIDAVIDARGNLVRMVRSDQGPRRLRMHQEAQAAAWVKIDQRRKAKRAGRHA
jgi:hypothetical protein